VSRSGKSAAGERYFGQVIRDFRPVPRRKGEDQKRVNASPEVKCCQSENASQVPIDE
jgi:hypothetical protein